MIRLTTDFECGNGKNIKQLSSKHFSLEEDGDKADGYCAYYSFDIINEGEATEVTVDLLPDTKFGKPIDASFASAFPTTAWIKPESFHRYRPLRGQLPELVDGKITLKVPVGKDERLRVSMTYAAPYSEISENIRKIAKERPERCKLFSLGKSVQGREILGLQTGTPGKPKILCIAGQHPHEHAGVWGVLAIADFMSTLLPDAQAIADEFQVLCIPMTNPDGNVMGTNAFNAEGLDMYYPAFGDTPDAPEPDAHENRLLWKWAVESKPALWVNFHCYTGWQLNSEYPFDGYYEIKDRSLIKDKKQRMVYEAICDTMRLETDAPSTHAKASIHPESTLCYQLAKRYSIPHVLYELNNGTAGKHAATQRTLHVFRRVVNTLRHFVK